MVERHREGEGRTRRIFFNFTSTRVFSNFSSRVALNDYWITEFHAPVLNEKSFTRCSLFENKPQKTKQSFPRDIFRVKLNNDSLIEMCITISPQQTVRAAARVDTRSSLLLF